MILCGILLLLLFSLHGRAWRLRIALRASKVALSHIVCHIVVMLMLVLFFSLVRMLSWCVTVARVDPAKKGQG